MAQATPRAPPRRRLWPPPELEHPEFARVARQDVVVRDTGTARGLGAYARVPIRRGALLGVYRGELLSDEEARARYGDGLRGAYLIYLDAGAFVDAADPAWSDWTARMNDARGTGHAVNIAVGTLRGLHAAVVATRDIAAGDELLWDYGQAYWRGTPVEGQPLLTRPASPPRTTNAARRALLDPAAAAP